MTINLSEFHHILLTRFPLSKRQKSRYWTTNPSLTREEEEGEAKGVVVVAATVLTFAQRWDGPPLSTMNERNEEVTMEILNANSCLLKGEI